MVTDDRCKLFVAGLPDSISEAVLRQLFEATGGTVVDVSVPRDRATGRTRGFGFVTMSNEDEARDARQALDGSMQSGRSISVRPFQSAPPKRGDAPRTDAPSERDRGGTEDRTLYLGNLPYDTSAPEVEQMLERAGASSAVRVNLPLDPNGRPRGFGFVTFASAESAQAAVDALREAELKGRRVSASIAHARGERPARPARPPMGGGGGPPPRPPRNDGPRWGGNDFGGAPAPSFSDEGGGDDRRGGEGGRRRAGPGAKDNKKKRGRGAAERGRNRRDGEGLRAPRARGFYDDDDDRGTRPGAGGSNDEEETSESKSAEPDEE
jgi:RNA recognition motif-containing protein